MTFDYSKKQHLGLREFMHHFFPCIKGFVRQRRNLHAFRARLFLEDIKGLQMQGKIKKVENSMMKISHRNRILIDDKISYPNTDIEVNSNE